MEKGVLLLQKCVEKPRISEDLSKSAKLGSIKPKGVAPQDIVADFLFDGRDVVEAGR